MVVLKVGVLCFCCNTRETLSKVVLDTSFS